ncbi:hypothetical protein Q3G72_004368 [Acer saccharum]|nr:hypothetical protein Q3G72_004368 [Acer saccharum]
MDVKSAFLNGFLQEEVFVEQPKGFVDAHHPNHVYRLKKALYGLKQAPRAWYEHLTQFLVDNNYTRGSIDKTLFIKRDNDELFIAQIYVDDIVFGSTNNTKVQQFVDVMSHEFEMSLVGELSYFLCLQIRQLDDGIFISQAKYAKNLVKKFGLEKAKHCDTPMSTTLKLSKDASGKSVDQTLYRGMIGSLLYLTASRPDISFSVGVCARYQSDPKESYLSSVKRVIRFVNGTSNYGIWYSFDTNPSLVGYSDADWAGNCDDRKSTSGGCFFLGNNLVSWFCKKQNSISLSTAEAEYIATGSGCTQLIWMKQMLVDYGFNQGTLTLFCDNMRAINISMNPVQHSRTKHIDIRHHFIREFVENKCIVLEHWLRRLALLVPRLCCRGCLILAYRGMQATETSMSLPRFICRGATTAAVERQQRLCCAAVIVPRLSNRGRRATEIFLMSSVGKNNKSSTRSGSDTKIRFSDF